MLDGYVQCDGNDDTGDILKMIVIHLFLLWQESYEMRYVTSFYGLLQHRAFSLDPSRCPQHRH